MTYSSGNTILVPDYNGSVNTVNSVVGPMLPIKSGDGYGDSALIYGKCNSTVSADWGDLIDAVKKAATHPRYSQLTYRTNPNR